MTPYDRHSDKWTVQTCVSFPLALLIDGLGVDDEVEARRLADKAIQSHLLGLLHESKVSVGYGALDVDVTILADTDDVVEIEHL
jgi:hypothetical protein